MSGRPEWLSSGVWATDKATGRTGRVLTVGRRYDYTGHATDAFLVPPGSGNGWVAQIKDLRPMSESEAMR
jgi:hypothetical protein